MGCETRVRGLTHTWSKVKVMTTLAALGVTWIPVTTLEPEGLFYRTLVYRREESQDPFSDLERGQLSSWEAGVRAPQLPIETGG